MQIARRFIRTPFLGHILSNLSLIFFSRVIVNYRARENEKNDLEKERKEKKVLLARTRIKTRIT